MQYPKPTIRKHRAKKKPPLFPLGYCYRCDYYSYGRRTTGLERHHLYSGNPDRQHSEYEGLYVDLDNDCHELVTNEKDKQFIAHLKQEGQRRHEARHGAGSFKNVFGRNYI